jgi:hypothetical protein
VTALSFFHSRCRCTDHSATEPGSTRCHVDHTRVAQRTDELRTLILRNVQLRSEAVGEEESCLAHDTPESLYAAILSVSRTYLDYLVQRQERDVPMTDRGAESELAALYVIADLYDVAIPAPLKVAA